MNTYDDSNSDIYECAYCNSVEDLFWGADPFAEEIHGDDTEMWLCRECIYQSSMDI